MAKRTWWRARRYQAVCGIMVAAGLLTAACGGSTASTGSAATPGPSGSTAAGLPGQPAPPASLIKQAKSEGKLVWYSGMGINLTQIGQAFTDKYGIPVRVVSDASTPLEAKINAEAQAGDAQGDVFSGVYSSYFPQALNSGYIQPVSTSIPDFSAHYPASYLLNGGDFAVHTIIPVVMAYNSSKITPAQAPKTYADLGQPQWKGKIAAFDPSLSIGGLEFYDAIKRHFGENALKALGANNIKFYSSPVAVLQAVASGEQPITISATAGAIKVLTQQGAPVKAVTPRFQVVTDFVSVAIAHAPDPAAAKLFLYWVYSQAGQAALNQQELSDSPLYPSGLSADSDSGNPTSAAANRSLIETLLHDQS